MTAQYECYQKIMQDPIQRTEGKHDFNLNAFDIVSLKKTNPLHHHEFLRFMIINGVVANFSGI